MAKNIFLGLGTNLGNREKNLKTAIEELKKIAKVEKQSSVYETEPVGYKEQGKFLNMVVLISTKLKPLKLLGKLQEIELKMGREKTGRIKNGPRIIDLDILMYGNKKIVTEKLKIPHPRINRRKFVTIPLKEIYELK